jgi:L,D-peptidoglycan transpeptidase YkuD (ErfK/YbiS/YcfS/YnhG family)
MIAGARRTAGVVVVALAALGCATEAGAQSCPALLIDAKRLVLVTAKTMNDKDATMRLYERASASQPWRPLGAPEPAVVGKRGMGWSRFFAKLARPGEPIKIDGDKRAPAGVYRIGRSFGTLPSSRPGYLHITSDTICVDDPSSPAYNSIASRARLGSQVHAENMSAAPRSYGHGLLVDYPTDAKAKAGSCIFIHVWGSSHGGTSGCVALPEPRVKGLQDFSAGGAVLAILPQTALDRLAGCVPEN